MKSRRAQARECETEQRPGAFVAVELEQSRESPQRQEEGRAQKAAHPGQEFRLVGRDGCGGCAHVRDVLYFTSGRSACISLILAKARRTWGMAMEPPTTRATLRASMTSARFQPTSPQRTRW